MRKRRWGRERMKSELWRGRRGRGGSETRFESKLRKFKLSDLSIEKIFA